MVMLVHDNRQDLAGFGIHFVAIEPPLLLHVLAAFVNDDLLKALQVRDAVLNAARPLVRGRDVESGPAHVGDGFRSRAVRFDRPRPRAGYRVEQLRQLVDFDAEAERFLVDEELLAYDEGPHQRRGIGGEAPVRPVKEADAFCRRLERFHARALAEDHRIGDGARMTVPDVIVSLLVDGLEVAALGVQRGREPGIVLPVHRLHDGAGRRLHDEALIGRIAFLAGVEANPDPRALLADGRDQDVPGFVGNALRFLHPANIDAFERLDFLDRLAQALEDEQRAGVAGDRRFGDLEPALQAEIPDLILQQPVDRVGDGALVLAGA